LSHPRASGLRGDFLRSERTFDPGEGLDDRERARIVGGRVSGRPRSDQRPLYRPAAPADWSMPFGREDAAAGAVKFTGYRSLAERPRCAAA
jgi:hypothetical protein